jgi:hypothetical protein
MKQNSKPADEKYTEQETAERRDAAIRRMLNTPPKPHSEMKIGKLKSKRALGKVETKPAKAKKR